MSIVNRLPKAGSGTPNYIADTLIEANEVNDDFNTIYDDYDGNVDSSNIRAGSITGDRLVPGTITVTELGDGSVTTPKIVDGAVTAAKLAQDASTPAFGIGIVNPSLSFSTVETTLVTLPSVTTRGGRVLLTGTIGWVYSAAVQSAATIHLRIRESGVELLLVEYAVISPGVTGALTYPLPSPSFLYQPVAGTYVYTVTAQVTLNAVDPGLLQTHSGGAAGVYSVVEFA